MTLQHVHRPVEQVTTNDKNNYFIYIFIVGVQRSIIYCRNKETKQIADAFLCDNLSAEHLDAPTRMRKCHLPPCPYE